MPYEMQALSYSLFAAVFAAAVGCLIYRLGKAFGPSEDTRATDLANAVVVRVAILHALIVALALPR